MSGYHLADIPRGVYGELSKIREELEELQDAHDQGVRVMVLCELSDLIGAVRGFLRCEFPDVSLNDLVKMADVTERAFEAGDR